MVTGAGVTAGETDPEATGAMAAGIMAPGSAFREVGLILVGRTVALSLLRAGASSGLTTKTRFRSCKF